MEPTHLTDARISTTDLRDRLLRRSDGAIVTFEGTVRDHHEGHGVESIFYEAYRPLAEKEIGRILAGIEDEMPGVAVDVVHRLGLLQVGDVSIAIVAVASHRAEAFEACRAAIDRIKQTVPIWKKERSAEGEEWQGWQGDDNQ
ncbi:MAG: molybdenum cofactor biosynthesis protein MoaE [Thermoanaerobaculia bacterium]